MSITLPAAVLDALGGLQDGDAPVLVTIDNSVPHALHPLHVPPPWAGTLLLPASAPALLQLLARYVQMDLLPGEVPRWLVVPLIGWALETPRPNGHRYWFDQLPTVHADMPRMRALGEGVVWLARLERIKPHQPWVTAGSAAKRIPMAVAERQAGLPPWEVRA